MEYEFKNYGVRIIPETPEAEEALKTLASWSEERQRQLFNSLSAALYEEKGTHPQMKEKLLALIKSWRDLGRELEDKGGVYNGGYGDAAEFCADELQKVLDGESESDSTETLSDA